MTPLGIEIMLHYYYSAADYRQGDHRAPAVIEMIDGLVDRDLLWRSLQPNEHGKQYEVTNRGLDYIEAIMAVEPDPPSPANDGEREFAFDNEVLRGLVGSTAHRDSYRRAGRP